jgi:hypothetical protein
MVAEEFDPSFDWSVFQKLGAANLRSQDAINELIANSIDSWIEKFTPANRKNLKIDILYDKEANTVLIKDNAFGLDSEELKKTTTLGKSNKDDSDDRLMGTFGFGLTVATSSMGSSYEMFSIKKGNKDDKVSKVTFPTDKLAIKNTKARPTFEKIAKSRTPLSDVQHGSAVLIKGLKSELPGIAALSKHLGFSWKYFLDNKNQYNKSVTISISDGEREKLIEPLGIEEFIEKQSLISIKIPVKWENGDGSTGEDEITGNVGWAKTGGTQDSTSGGVNIYRKGQLIRLLDKSTDNEDMWYKWHPTVSRFYAEISVDFISSNPEKDYLDTTTPQFKSAQEAFQNAMKESLKFVKFRNTAVNSNYGLLVTLRDWKKLWGVELTKKEEEEISSSEVGGTEVGGTEVGGTEGGGTEGGGTEGGGTEGGGTEGGGTEGGDEIKDFEIVNNERFNFKGKEYIIKLQALEGKTPAMWNQFYDEDLKSWTIFINEKTGIESLDKTISKIRKTASNSEFMRLSTGLIIRDNLRSMMMYEGIPQTLAEQYADLWLKEYYK